jgi:hypothetical protein
MLIGLGALAAPSGSAPTEWRASAAAEVTPASHGAVDVGVRSGAWEAQLFTDTLEVRRLGAFQGGRWSVGGRVQALAAGMMIDPWTAGAPDPARRRLALYAGVDGEYVRFLGGGLYARAALTLREWLFLKMATTEIALPGPTFIASPELTLGLWREAGEVRLTAGADLGQNGSAPRASVVARFAPRLLIGPRLELRAGIARGQDDLTRTRLGGLNPYVVPLAGLAWAEHWVERYLALRAGPRLVLGPLEVSLVADVAWFDAGERRVGLGLLGRLDLAPWFVEASLGHAPDAPRAPGLGRTTAWLSIGRAWAPW